MKGKRIAILGLGRSGLASGKAALAMGAQPVVFDEKSEADLAKPELLEKAQSSGIEVHLGQPFSMKEAGKLDLLVANPAVPKWHPGLLEALDAGVEVISEVELAFRISKAPIVAITGTNGKSSTTVMTYLCLRACAVDAVLCGNIYGSGYDESPLSEAALNSTPDQVLVAEISSFQLEWVKEFRPKAAAITNITPDHLDRYESFDDYAATKKRIFAAFQGSDVAVLGPDLEGEFPGKVLKAYRSHWSGDSIEILGRRISKSDLPWKGEHHYANGWMAAVLAAAAQSNSAEIEITDCIVQGLKDFHGLAHRMVWIGKKDGVDVINNSMCTNPAAVVSSARTLEGKSHLLIGGINKGLDFDPLREYLASSEHEAYLFGTDAENLRGMLALDEPTYRTMEEAFKAATDRAKPGETIMLAPGCASTDQFRDFRHRGDVFKAIAMEWLKS